jgi:hypothetical protein
MSVLNGEISLVKNPDLMLFGVSVFDSDWFTMNEMS